MHEWILHNRGLQENIINHNTLMCNFYTQRTKKILKSKAFFYISSVSESDCVESSVVCSLSDADDSESVRLSE